MSINIFLSVFLLLSSGFSAYAQQTDIRSLFSRYDSLIDTDPWKAYELAVETEKLTAKGADSEARAQSLLNLGHSSLKIGNKTAVHEHLSAALAIYEQINHPLGICRSYRQLGILCMANMQNDLAMEYQTKALKIAERLGVLSEIAWIENNIAVIYFEKERYGQALELFKQSAEKCNEAHFDAVILANMAVCYLQAGHLDSARWYYEKSLGLCRESNNALYELKGLEGLANVYLDRGDYSKALEYTAEAIDREKRLKLVYDLLVSYNRMGLICYHQGRTEEALEYYHMSIAIADSLNSSHLPYIYANLSLVYESAREYKKALDYNELFHRKKDSIDRLDAEMRVEQLLARYETSKKEQEIMLLKKEQSLKEAELKRKDIEFEKKMLEQNLHDQARQHELIENEKKINLLKKEGELQEALLVNHRGRITREQLIRNITIAGSLLIAAIALILFRVYRQKVKDRELLAQKNEELNKQRTLDLLHKYELKAIRAFVEGQEKEKKRIAGDLHDGIAGTLAAIKMRMQRHATTYNMDACHDIISSLDDVYNEVRTLSHHLTPYNVIQGSYVDFLGKYLQEMKSASPFGIHFNVHGEERISVLTNEIKVELYRVIQEALTNAAKYAKAGNVDIQLLISGELINLIIEDDGVGFRYSENTPGIGLRNMKSRMQKLNGTLHIDASPGRGTIINVDIPLTS